MFPGSPESSPPLDAGPGPAGRPVRRASRSTDDRMIGGVAGGLAEHLGLDPLHVRIAFVVAGFVGGFGLVFYAGLWMILPADRHLDQASPGLEAATRQPRRWLVGLRRVVETGEPAARLAAGRIRVRPRAQLARHAAASLPLGAGGPNRRS